ncbi:amino acid ABC transporter permease [Bacillaceae bacterium]
MNWEVIVKYQEMFLTGAMWTVILTTVGVACGTLLGLFLGLGRLAKNPLVALPSRLYITVFRGTPLFVQILLIHYAAIPSVWLGLFDREPPSALFSGFVALSLNSAAYIAEIFRAGIQSIDRGQMEAARSLGMTHGQAMRYIILPQAFKRMIPPLGNEFIALLKDSSLLAVIAAPELAYAGYAVAKSTFARWEAYLTIAAGYLVMTLVISRFVAYLEKRYRTGS